jgi:hypothetical protein
MKAKVMLCGLCAALAAGAVQAQSAIDMKPGLWDVRILKMEQDGKDMLAMMRQVMGSMPPEQRKNMGMNATLDERVCYSPEMVKSDQSLVPQTSKNIDCQPPKVNRSGNRATFEMVCKSEMSKGDSVSKGESVVTGNQINSKVETVIALGGAKHVMLVESQMTFIGSDCGDVKPLDQIARQMQQGGPGK